MLRTAGEKVKECSDSGLSSKSIIASLGFVLQQDSLEAILRHDSICGVLMNAIDSIEKTCSNGPLEIMAGSLSIQAKTIIGFE